MFVDEVNLSVQAGDGGNGCMSFRREKFVPRGGPNGGTGGKGGSIFLVASLHQNTLVTYRFHPEFKGERGGHGEGSNRTGHDGADLTLEVPPGTVIYEHSHGELLPLADLAAVGDRALVARGGRGGRGNAHFATSINRAPRRVEPGEPGEVRSLHLAPEAARRRRPGRLPERGQEHARVAHLGGAAEDCRVLPRSRRSPRILGVVHLSDDRSFVVADVPGLIEGAHEGHGLGTKFLAHLERTQVLVHLIDVSSASDRDPVRDFDVITHELAAFAGSGDETAVALAHKPRLVAANKIDALDDPDRLSRLTAHAEALGLEVFPVSAVTGDGLPALLEAMWRVVAQGIAPPVG